MKKQLLSVFVALFCCGVFLILGILVDRKLLYFGKDKVLTTYSLINSDFSGELTSDQLVKGLVDSLHDKYSYYLNNEDYKAFQKEDLGSSELTFKVLEGNILYLKLPKIRSKIDEEMDGLTNIVNDNKIDRVIVDLRDNWGGETEAGIYFADAFVSSGTILKEIYAGNRQVVTTAKSGGMFEAIRVVVLVNRETASAAEQITAALRDNGRALVIGEPTYGKGVFTNDYPFWDGTAINLTIGYWLRPNGETVSGVGIKPDIVVENNTDNSKDVFLEKALETLSSN